MKSYKTLILYHNLSNSEGGATYLPDFFNIYIHRNASNKYLL